MSKLRVRTVDADDIPQLVEMYMDLVSFAYPTRERAPKIVFYEIVLEWFVRKDRIRIVCNEEENVGFSLVTKHNAGGAVETYLDAEVTYIKEKHRKGRGAYLIYNDVFEFAKKMGMGIMSTSTPDSSPIVNKRFGAQHAFNHYEVPKDFINSINKLK